jgi:hypothetical protein
MCLVSATQVLDHVPSSPAESSCISPPHCRPGPRPGTPLSRRPAAADVRTPPAGQNMSRIPPTLGDPICTGIFHTSAKDSRTSPRTGRQDQPARSCHDPAICPLADPIAREEEVARGHRGHLARRITYRAIRAAICQQGCSIRGQPRDRLAQAAARQCPATILLTGGSSRQLSGGAVILNSVIMSPLVS